MKHTTDILVIGSGIAGLSFALKAAQFAHVTVVTKKELVESNTNYAQGGIAAVQASTDSFALHVKDTLAAGDGLCDTAAVDVLVRSGPQVIKELLRLGVGFKQVNGALVLSQEGGHSARRIAFVHDTTGRAIEATLAFHCRANKNITLLEEHMGVDLIVGASGHRAQGTRRSAKGSGLRAQGAYVLNNATGEVSAIAAKAVVLASGGYGQVYAYTSNPRIATGDGVAMAFRAGAALMDMEFVQFHPTTVYKKAYPHYLISEAVRGEGGYLLNHRKQRFMKGVHARAELATRDIVSRAITRELAQGPVYLDIRHKGEAFIKERFPAIYEQLWWYGIKMDQDLIPVGPAAHYTCGGVWTDTRGRTTIPGLYAFGEVAATGVHGANRLASNSLLESMVFAIRAAADIRTQRASRSPVQAVAPYQHGTVPPVAAGVARIKSAVQRTMWQYVGIERDEQGLQDARAALEKLHARAYTMRTRHISAALMEAENMALVGLLTAGSALVRTESRGTHYRRDFPKRNNRIWQKHIFIQKGDTCGSGNCPCGGTC